jgi:hypothetical protein
MHDSQTTPHDPYRKLATSILIHGIREYIAPMPKDTGHPSVDNRRKQWAKYKAEADFFLFRDYYLNGSFHMCCMLMKMDALTARKALLKANEGGPVKLKELIKTLDRENKSKALGIANDK